MEEEVELSKQQITARETEKEKLSERVKTDVTRIEEKDKKINTLEKKMKEKREEIKRHLSTTGEMKWKI